MVIKRASSNWEALLIIIYLLFNPAKPFRQLSSTKMLKKEGLGYLFFISLSCTLQKYTQSKSVKVSITVSSVFYEKDPTCLITCFQSVQCASLLTIDVLELIDSYGSYAYPLQPLNWHYKEPFHRYVLYGRLLHQDLT